MNIIRIANSTANIHRVSNTACQTIYDVDGVTVRLFVIVGGIPALALEDHSYTVRFPYLEKWDSEKHWDKVKGHFDFQDPNNLQGPTYNILPEGRLTLEKYVHAIGARRDLAQERWNNLPIQENIYSPKVLDKEQRTYVQAKLELNPRRVGGIGMIHGDKEQIRLLPAWWKNANDIFTNIWKNHYAGSWDELTEEEYQNVVRFLNIYLDYFQ